MLDELGGLTARHGWRDCIKCLKREWNEEMSGKAKILKRGVYCVKI